MTGTGRTERVGETWADYHRRKARQYGAMAQRRVMQGHWIAARNWAHDAAGHAAASRREKDAP